ncbi:MAG: DUF4080 domain-containing protein [Clostridia bacterium]|nr:DUF4080 domain-containing protein [Clostridia bacterium]
MLNVTAACLNSKYIHFSSAPWCLAAGVREFSKKTVHITVLESTINSELDSFAEEIIETAPDVLSFSCYIWNITKTLELCKKIKTETDLVIVLGGPEVAYRREDVLERYPFVDFVLAGEGEFCFPEFLDAFPTPYNTPGLSYRKDGKIFSNPEGVYKATPPSPVTDEYLAALSGRICYIESSRGCPYRCAFCLSGRVSPLRFFDIEQTKADIIKLANSGTQTVKFVDRTFNSSERHANEILSFIKENYAKAIPEGVCFHFEIAGDILKESTMQLLKAMPHGAIQLEIGMQSFNEQTLLAINRITDTQKLISNITRLLSFGNMHIHIDLIAGLTGEDVKSFEKSFDTGFALRAHMLQMGFLKLLHGADMRENSDKYPCEFSSTPPYEVISTPLISKDEMNALKKCEDALERLYNSGRFHLTLDYLFKQGFTPFRLFYDFGNAYNGEGDTLEDYALALYDHFKENLNADILFEKISCDLLCSTGTLLPRFKKKDKRYKRIRAQFDKNIKIILLKDGIFAVDTDSPRNLFGRLDYKIYEHFQ